MEGPDPDAAGVLDRAMFWAELGLLASPTLLARAGRALQERAAMDAELARAMRLVEEHLTSRCLVLSRYSDLPAMAPGNFALTAPFAGVARAPLADGSPMSASYSMIPGGPLALGRNAPKKGLVSPASAGDSDGGLGSARAKTPECPTDGDASEAESALSDLSGPSPEPLWQAAGCQGIVEPTPLVAWLPILGCRVAHYVWLLVLTCMVIGLTVRAGLRAMAYKGDSSRADLILCRTGPMWEVLLAVKALGQVFLARSIRQILQGDTWSQLVHLLFAEGYVGELRKLALVALLISPVTLVGFWHDIHRGRAVGLFEATFSAVIMASRIEIMIFWLVVWRATMMSIWPLRNLLRDAPDSELDWLQFTRMYQEDVRRVDSFWSTSGLANGTAFSLITWFMYILWEGFNLTTGTYTFKRFVGLVAQLSMALAFLLCLATISSARYSHKHTNKSLIVSAMLRPIRRQDAVEQLSFQNTLRYLRCGPEVTHIGMVTMSSVAPFARVVVAAVPVCWGIAIRLRSTSTAFSNCGDSPGDSEI